MEDAILIALADEDLLDFVVHHEPTFNHDEIHRHVTVLALTRTRLIVGHTDDQPAEPPTPGSTRRPRPSRWPSARSTRWR